MSSIEERIRLAGLTSEERIKARSVDRDSDASRQVGKKCCFCRQKIILDDITPPNHVFTNRDDIAAHGACLQYCRQKYPTTPISLLEGKISIYRVRNAGL